MDPIVREATYALRQFMFDQVYTNSAAKAEEHKAVHLVETLYLHYVKYPETLPDEFRLIADRESVPRAVADYVSGMTDNYAVSVYKSLFIPDFWSH